MIASYKRKANIAGAFCLAVVIGPIIVVNVLAWTGHKVVTGDNAMVLGDVIMIALALPYFYGAWALLKAKGRSGAWGLLAMTLIGMFDPASIPRTPDLCSFQAALEVRR